MTDEAYLFFAGRPGAAALYEIFERQVLERVENVRIRVQKTQISFSNRYNFAFVSLLPVRRKADRPDEYITVTFGLRRRLDSPRIDAAVQPYPERWTHHVLIAAPEEIDEQLLGWIQEAAVFSARK